MPGLEPLREPLRLVLALVFAAASTIYGVVWMQHVRQEPTIYLGVTIEDRPQQFGVVLQVREGSPAARAGLRPGDRVLAINGRPFQSLDPFYDAVSRGRPGDEVLFEVVRTTGERLAARVTLASRQTSFERGSLPRRVVLQIIGTYPLLFLTVGLVILFQRLDSLHAWLLSLMFVGDLRSID